MTELTDLEDESLSLDLHTSGVLHKRFASLSGMPWEITEAGENLKLSAKIAQEARLMFGQVKGFKAKLRMLAWALFYGRGAMENHWRIQGTGVRYCLESMEWIAPRRLSFGDERELRLIDSWRTTGFFREDGAALRDYPGKFTTWVPPMFSVYPEKDGLGPRLMYWCFFKRFSWRMRMILTEIFALPWRIIEAEQDATVSWDQLKEAAAMLENLGQDSTAALPPGGKLNITTPDGTASDIFQMTHNDVNLEVSKIVLGNTGTTEGNESNRSNSVIQKSEQDLILLDDAGGLSGAVQSGIMEPFAWLNWGEEGLASCPQFALTAETQRDIEQELKHVEKLLAWGLPVSEKQLRELTGWRAPAEGESVVQLLPAQGPTMPSDGGMGGEQSAPAAEGSIPTAGILEEEGVAGAGDRAEEALAQRLTLASEELLDAVSDELPCDEERVVSQFMAVATASVEGILAQLEALESYDGVEAVLGQERDLSALEWQLFESCLLGALQGAESSAEAMGAPERLQMQLESWLPPWLQGVRMSPSLLQALKRFLRKQVLTRSAWDALLSHQKAYAFTVAHLLDTRAIELVREEVGKALAAGTALKGFVTATRERMVSAGFLAGASLTGSHLETVFRNGVVGAYADGRQRHMTQPEVLAKRPYWQVQGVRDSRQRPSHLAAHGKVMRADDPGWQIASPPYGHNCRCRLVARSAEWVEANGITPHTGPLPDLPDEGWTNSNPPPVVMMGASRTISERDGRS
jgi:SPP1 gp7 family putative phage head morphogenesis protein